MSGADFLTTLNAFYNTCCSGHVELEDTRRWIQLSGFDDINQDMMKNIFKGVLKPGELHLGYYFDVASKLTQAISQGLKVKKLEVGDPKAAMFAKFKQNVFAFSSAKTFALMQQYTDNLKDEKGELRSYGSFRNKCIPIGQVFNDNHLRAEYNMAVAKSQMAAKWDSLQQYSMLQFRTAGDDHVRKSHKALDGLTLPRDHSFWRTHWPPLDWGCRCTVIPAEGRSEHVPEKAKEAELKVPPYFQGNSGIEHIAFAGSHPVFMQMENAKRGNTMDDPKRLYAERNYAMQPAEKLVRNGSLPELTLSDDLEAAKRQFLSLNAQTPEKYGFTPKKWAHLDENEDEARWKYAHHAKEILEKPDEVWSTFDKGNNTLYKRHIKYYKGQPLVFSYPEGQPHKWTMYAADMSETGEFKKLRENIRCGTLMHRK